MFKLNRCTVKTPLKAAILLGLASASGHSVAAISVAEETALRQILQCVTKVDNTLVISGCDLQLTNGTDTTHMANGLGNLILGYNTSQAPTIDHKGSHNLVIGEAHSYQSTGGLLAGFANKTTAPSAVVAGRHNHVAGINSTILGGINNIANGSNSAIVGGQENTTTSIASWSTVSGGQTNIAGAEFGSVVAGRGNQALAPYASVTGGEFNKVTARAGVVVGGKSNTTDGEAGVVLGGRFNQANGETSTLAGGQNRSVSGINDFRAGGIYFANE